MEKKIDIAELLKNCPKGMELDCTMLDNVVFEKIDTGSPFHPIIIRRTDTNKTIHLTKYGQYSIDEDYKCVIFPKGKTTWEGFEPPCTFKSGDVLVSQAGNIVLLSHIDSEDIVHYHCILTAHGRFSIAENTDIGVGRYYECVLANEQQKQRMYDKIKSSGCKYNQSTNKLEPKFKDGDILYAVDEGNAYIFILKHMYENGQVYCHLNLKGDDLRIHETWLTDYNPTHRLATEEEKQKLFDAIKANGYEWNEETKTLEKLFEPVFKDGDIITDNYFNTICIFKGKGSIEGTVDFYCGIDDAGKYLFIKDIEDQDEHFGEIGGYNFATEEEKAKLFQAIKENGYKWNAETKTLEKLVEPKFKVGDKIKIKQLSNPRHYIIKTIESDRYILNNNQFIRFEDEHIYELVHGKFDITTLKPFESRVLMRDIYSQVWKPAIYGFKEFSLYVAVGGNSYVNCIPYEGNEHLLGTTDDCDNYYKTWE